MEKTIHYTTSRNEDCTKTIDEWGTVLRETVDRYGWDGKYKKTDVFNRYGEKIYSFVRED